MLRALSVLIGLGVIALATHLYLTKRNEAHAVELRTRFWSLANRSGTPPSELHALARSVASRQSDSENTTMSLAIWVVERLYWNPSIEPDDGRQIGALCSGGSEPELCELARALVDRRELPNTEPSAPFSSWRGEVTALYSPSSPLPRTNSIPSTDSPNRGPAAVERLLRDGQVLSALRLATRLRHGVWQQLLENIVAIQSGNYQNARPGIGGQQSQLATLLSALIDITHQVARSRAGRVDPSWTSVWALAGSESRLQSLVLSAALAVGVTDADVMQLSLDDKPWARWLLISWALRDWDPVRLESLVRGRSDLLSEQARVLCSQALCESDAFRSTSVPPVSVDGGPDLPDWLHPSEPAIHDFEWRRWPVSQAADAIDQGYEQGHNVFSVAEWLMPRLPRISTEAAPIWAALSLVSSRLSSVNLEFGRLESLIAPQRERFESRIPSDLAGQITFLSDLRSGRTTASAWRAIRSDLRSACRAIGDLGAQTPQVGVNTPDVDLSMFMPCGPDVGLRSWLRVAQAADRLLPVDEARRYLESQVVSVRSEHRRLGCLASVPSPSCSLVNQLLPLVSRPASRLAN